MPKNVLWDWIFWLRSALSSKVFNQMNVTKCDEQQGPAVGMNPAEQCVERSLEKWSLSPLGRWYLATRRDAISPCKAKWCHFLWWYNLAWLWEIKGPSDVLPLLLKKRLCSPSNLPPPAIFFVHRLKPLKWQKSCARDASWRVCVCVRVRARLIVTPALARLLAILLPLNHNACGQ